MTSFQLVGIDATPFEPLFALPDSALAKLGAVRRRADESPGYPCRISLEDAKLGEDLLLLPHVHQPALSPYHASGPIYVRRGARQQRLPVNTVSGYVTTRLMSARAYDAAHMIIDAAVCEGRVVADEILRLFSNRQVAYIHLHNAKRGCFSCRVERAESADVA
jgi:Protein of unknown function (DUF1203)